MVCERTRNEGGCHQVPRLPRKVPRRHQRPKPAQARHQSQPSDISATPATQNEGGCDQVPRLPREIMVDVTKCHACHAQCRGVTRDQAGPSAPPSAIFHTQLCHTPSFTLNFVTHHLPHTTLSHTIFHIQLCHTPSFTYNFVTHHLSHKTLSHTIFHIQLCHTTLSHTIFHTHLCHTPSFTYNFVTHTIFHISHLPSFCVAGVALMALGGALGPAWSRMTPRHFCVAGVTLGDIHFDFTWQAWHNLTSTVVLRGRRGTHGTGWRAWAILGPLGRA